jgi:hypothetical protein
VNFFKMLSVTALVLFAASIARADDTRVNMNGGPGGSPPCGSNSASADPNTGALTTDCNVTNATGTVTTFSFEVADANTIGGGLTCNSNLTNIGWTGTLTSHISGGVDICTLTAPESVSDATDDFLEELGDPHHVRNDHDCDLDDFVLGIPVGCDIKINNTVGGLSPFVGGAPVGFSSNGDSLPSLPEPGTLGLVLVGLTGLPLIRRKLAR